MFIIIIIIIIIIFPHFFLQSSAKLTKAYMLLKKNFIHENLNLYIIAYH